MSSKTVSKAAMIFPPVKINPPAKIPIKREVITSFVINAKAMATIGGTIDKIPNSIFFSLSYYFYSDFFSILSLYFSITSEKISELDLGV